MTTHTLIMYMIKDIWARQIAWESEILQARTLHLIKKKLALYLQIFRRLGKTMKTLQCIPNTNMNTCVPAIF